MCSASVSSRTLEPGLTTTSSLSCYLSSAKHGRLYSIASTIQTSTSKETDPLPLGAVPDLDQSGSISRIRIPVPGSLAGLY